MLLKTFMSAVVPASASTLTPESLAIGVVCTLRPLERSTNSRENEGLPGLRKIATARVPSKATFWTGPLSIVRTRGLKSVRAASTTLTLLAAQATSAATPTRELLHVPITTILERCDIQLYAPARGDNRRLRLTAISMLKSCLALTRDPDRTLVEAVGR